ncbi:Bifunctional NAD(P)H-hydrate repair enzyme [Seminavis robusta]|uniref:Bifunctional NAD(P)H-hydrate repair enzyme n=1 Tax=Seminavis robusta TaxID=568900 RepID=A0A9N8HMV9_9STRA|nr:Bifunctional NAD(P)H-hydrate repair enzyme [Seminavis robusta]|eukprot:Sro936_g222100.1 Bifunctional NAD(P)H-hydrate repair enzyme (249) ;mRNA; f:28322-29068
MANPGPPSAIDLPLLDGEEARRIDLEVTEKLGRVRVLEGVATRVADTLLYHLDITSSIPFLFVAGKGNNGANAIAAARMLHLRGRETFVVLLVDPAKDDLRPNIREQIDLYHDFAGGDRLFPLDLDKIQQFEGVLIDGILGTGITDPPRGISKQAIQAMNQAGNNAKGILAIDIPSGLNHITGEAPGECIRAKWTLNLHMLKRGQLQEVARPYVGELYSAESGLGFSTFPGLEASFAAFYKDGPIRKV